MGFAISCKLSLCQSLFSRKNKTNITNMSSEIVQTVEIIYCMEEFSFKRYDITAQYDRRLHVLSTPPDEVVGR